MATLKRRTAIAVTVGLWLAAAGSAAALGVHLNRGIHPGTPGFGTVRSVQGPAPATLVEPQVLSVAPVVIAAPWPQRPASASGLTPSTPVARDILEMGCAHSRELDIGSGRVESCE